MNEVEQEFKSKGNVIKKFTLPMLMWEEWELDCKENFNNTYSLKMQFDHNYRKEMALITQLLAQDILELKEELFELKAAQSEQNSDESPKRQTFGEKING